MSLSMGYRLLVLFLSFLSFNAVGQHLDPNIYYFSNGKGVKPWEMSLQFGEVKLDEAGEGSTVRGALVASTTEREEQGNVLRLKWSPKDVKTEWGTQNENVSYLTLRNTTKPIDLSSVREQAALVFDIKILKTPNKLVDLKMECNWDWKCRSGIPLKSALKKLPKKKWISVPIPLQCFDNGRFDFSKITNVFMLHTSGKMEIELGDIRLSAFPADKVKCAGR